MDLILLILTGARVTLYTRALPYMRQKKRGGGGEGVDTALHLLLFPCVETQPLKSLPLHS
jgi:hypothetical protein